jgi:hypothetical protein
MHLRHLSSVPVALSLAAAAAALVAAGSASAVDVRGQVRIAGKLEDPALTTPQPPFKPYWEEWNGFLDVRSSSPSASRLVSLVLRGASATAATGCTYALQGGAFAPAAMVAVKGTTLRIENTDGCTHELFVDGLDAFAPLQTAPGNARTVPLERTGHFVVRDRFYPHVVGHLHVVDTLAACAELDDQGRFRFPSVPDGAYELEAYYLDRKVASQRIDAAGKVHTIDTLTVSLTGQ